MNGRSEIKKNSKECLKNNYLKCFILALILRLLSGISMSAFVNDKGHVNISFNIVSSTIIMLFFFLPLTVYVNKFYLLSYRGERPSFKQIFSEEMIKKYFKILAITLWSYLWVIIWTFALVIPGIIKALSYSMAPYLAAENPDIGARRSLKLSMRMMKNRKMDLFILVLSFIGWYLLTSLACLLVELPLHLILNGNLALVDTLISSVLSAAFVFPYLMLSQAGFYDNVKKSSLENGIVTQKELEEIYRWNKKESSPAEDNN